jgi:superfamily II DNA or RNA helicase
LTITLRPHQRKALNEMLAYDKGQLIIPTGGGKTLCMIHDIVENQKYIDNGSTIVVVAPRILLAEQLCSEFLEVIDTTHTHVMHVHSGETSHFSTTKAEKINLFVNTARTAGENVVIFTTYHSLHRLVEADIEVNTIYFDEAHNSVQRNFFPATEHFSADADRCYFFTATPKHSLSIYKPGMNDYEVYGKRYL